jgi:hypothetical protein
MYKAVQDELYEDYESMQFFKSDEWKDITSEQLAPIIKQIHEAVIEAGGVIYSEPKFQIMPTGDIKAPPETDFLIDPVMLVPDPLEFKTSYRGPQNQRHAAVVRYQTETHAPTERIVGPVHDRISMVLSPEVADEILSAAFDGRVESLAPITSCRPLSGANIEIDENIIPLPYLVMVILVSRPNQFKDYKYLSLTMGINADEL